MNTEESLLIQRLDELEEAVLSTDHTLLVRSSLALRQVLTDGNGALYQRFTGHKQVRFLVAQSAFVDVGPNRFIQAINPNAFIIPPPTQTLTLKEFLKTPLANLDTHSWTVRSHIRYAAHVLGGSHLGRPNEPGEPEFHALKHTYLMQGHDITGYYLKQIAAIVLRALRPMREAIENVSQFEGASGIQTFNVISIHPPPQYPSFLFDFGTSEEDGRISLFLDKGNILRLRVRHGTDEWSVRTGLLPTGTPLIVSFEVVSANDQTLASLRLGDMSLYRIIPGNHALPGQYAPHTMVLGSDYDGKSHSYFDFYTHAAVTVAKTKSEREEMLSNLLEHFLSAPKKTYRFRGRNFYVSNKHTRAELQQYIEGKAHLSGRLTQAAEGARVPEPTF